MKINEIYNKLVGDSYVFSKELTESLFEIVYAQYLKSEFADIDSGRRDFCRKRDTYELIANKVPKYLKANIDKLF